MKPLGFTLTEMKDLLESLDTLNGDGASRQQRSAAAHYMQECRTKAQESAARLRKHLAYAEELAEVLTARAAEVAGERE
jgi:DNA-binding transcriptional MerR regulator